MQIFDDQWKIWIWKNISEGCPKNTIFKVLVDSGFSYEVVKEELNHLPTVPVETILNPLAGPQPRMENQSDILRYLTEHEVVYPSQGERVMTDQAEIYTVDDVLNPEECSRLIEIMRGDLRPSTITSNDEKYVGDRTSKSCDLTEIKDPLIFDVNRRLCNLLGIHWSFAEGLQGQYYDVGEEYKPHADYFDPAIDKVNTEVEQRGQRTWTVMVYLNDPEAGGDTRFPHLEKTFEPRTGRAVIWNNLARDGLPNPQTIHQGMPVTSGHKAILTKWFRQQGEGRMVRKTEGEYLPSYTKTGIEKTRIPSKVYDQIRDFYLENREKRVAEQGVQDYVSGSKWGASEMIELPAPLKADLHEALQGVMEQWSGSPLEPTALYGIRRYNRDARLRLHRDRIETHIVSAILMIDQEIDEEWPLTVFDHQYRKHEVILQPGEMLFYEGARLTHGRPRPFKGNYFCNVFAHNRPTNHLEKLRDMYRRSLPA